MLTLAVAAAAAAEVNGATQGGGVSFIANYLLLQCLAVKAN